MQILRRLKMKTLLLLIVLLPVYVIAETHDVRITNFRFAPNNLEIKVGDTVRWTNNQGFHDVVEDNNSFSSGPPSSSAFVFEQTFNTVEEIFYYCSVHSTPGNSIDVFMNGRINVTADEPEFEINQGISGAWYFPDTSGSGLLMDVRPSDSFIFAAWFTYDEANDTKIGSPEQRWLIAQGNYEAGSASDLPLYSASGGVFDNPQDITLEEVGTMSLEFNDCTAAMVTYSFEGTELNGEFPIQRVLPGTESLCESLIEDNPE